MTQLPSTICGLSGLVELHAGGNPLQALPECIGNLTTLRSLIVSGNRLTGLPSSLGNLRSLSQLFIGSNQIGSLPESLGGLDSHTSFIAAGNTLRSLPAGFGQMRLLSYLGVSDNQLDSLPSDISGLVALRTLVATRNNIRQLPSNIAAMVTLYDIWLGSNKLTNVPAEMEQLPSLEHAHFTDNPFDTMPAGLLRCRSLRVFDIDHCGIRVWPESAFAQSSLGMVNARANQLECVPEVIGTHTTLYSLDLDSNRLAVLPESIIGLADNWTRPFLSVRWNGFCGVSDTLNGFLTRCDASWAAYQSCSTGVSPQFLGSDRRKGPSAEFANSLEVYDLLGRISRLPLRTGILEPSAALVHVRSRAAGFCVVRQRDGRGHVAVRAAS